MSTGKTSYFYLKTINKQSFKYLKYQMTTVATTTLMLGGMNMAFSAVTYPALVTDTINSTMPLLSESDFSWFGKFYCCQENGKTNKMYSICA